MSEAIRADLRGEPTGARTTTVEEANKKFGMGLAIGLIVGGIAGGVLGAMLSDDGVDNDRTAITTPSMDRNDNANGLNNNGGRTDTTPTGTMPSTTDSTLDRGTETTPLRESPPNPAETTPPR
ncbi:MAG: hypothetical protein H7Y88_08780 [Phycisphaerales bacterium]|nr:hypothetical protein [Phycisphaerales bacterium]